MHKNSRLAFVGAGKMVSAIVRSLLSSDFYIAQNLICCSANDGTSEKLSQQTGIRRAESIDELLSFEADILILGCKPQQLGEIANQFSNLQSKCIVLSIMAGINLERLSKSFPQAKNIVRSMPNTPGQIGEGITGFVFHSCPSEQDRRLITSVLDSLGESFELENENDIDRITAISGSGPAYLFEFTSALQAAAREIGLTNELAEKFAIQTILGSSKLLESSKLSPIELRNQVTSPNGTTQAALESFETSDLRKVILDGVKAANARSIELSNA